MKRVIIFFFCICLLFGCSTTPADKPEKRLQIVATLFPQYDFAKAICGGLAEVTLLLPPGADSHSYEPTPSDVIRINRADLFVYTGDVMEAWAASILKSLEGNPAVLDITAGISLHEAHAEHEEHEEDEASAGHEHGADPHVFTNPVLAIKMAENLEHKLCEIDPDNSNTYSERGAALRRELAVLDQSFRDIVAAASRKKLIFGGRFAFSYFVEEYGLDYDSAYDSCSSATEPAAAKLAGIIDRVREEKIPVVYYEELSDPKTTRLICEATGAKPLLLHSCHNISKDELARGETYLSLMRMNAEHIKEGLN